MSYSNANYLTNPNKLSTKVHYAPGGASSLSLAWDNTPMPSRSDRNRSDYYKQATEPTQNYQPLRQNPNYYQQPPQQPPAQQYSPYQQYPPSADNSNRILEEELQYYQSKNKQLQNNGHGNYEQAYQPQSHYAPSSQYSPPPPPQQQQYRMEQGYYGQQEMAKYGQQRPEELDLAIQQHRKRQESSSSQQYPQGQYMQEKTSVRVNNPPGGRSNIVFG